MMFDDIRGWQSIVTRIGCPFPSGGEALVEARRAADEDWATLQRDAGVLLSDLRTAADRHAGSE